jgi:hypothetical protein
VAAEQRVASCGPLYRLTGCRLLQQGSCSVGMSSAGCHTSILNDPASQLCLMSSIWALWAPCSRGCSLQHDTQVAHAARMHTSLAQRGHQALAGRQVANGWPV